MNIEIENRKERSYFNLLTAPGISHHQKNKKNHS